MPITVSRLKNKFTGNNPSKPTIIFDDKKDNRKKDRITLLVVISVFLVAYFYMLHGEYRKRTSRPSTIDLPPFADQNKYIPFEPDVTEDFASDADVTQKIPRIIHQTWKNTQIPPKFVPGIKSYAAYSSNWEYYLWTDESARDFIVDYYPELLPVWDGYLYKNDKIRRADAIRYVVLYHFGGLYADMDTMNYRSLDKVITKHACVFTPEPFEHAVSRGLVPYLINNAVMMCAPKHPFLKYLIDNLPAWSDMQALGDATGPGFLTTQYKLYHNLPREPDSAHIDKTVVQNKLKNDTTPYFNTGNISETDERYVYIANTHYFMHTLDVNSFQPLYDMCIKFHQLTELQKRACVNAKREGLERNIHPFAFIDHKWHMTYAWYNFYRYWPIFNYLFSTDIELLVPDYKIYTKS